MEKIEMKLSIFIICIIIVISVTTKGYSECDHPNSPEEVRIYFANGMSNTFREAKESKRVLQNELGMQDKDFGIAYNDDENWLLQLLHVYEQRKHESDEFWYWLRHMNEAPQWFRDEYVQKVGRFNENMVRNDPDLQKHIRQYIADLVSGKKVVIVAHSQGNFYANNAYRYIKINYPEYKNSIGIVSVATPSNWVEGGGSYVLNNVYTNNPEDLIINLVRSVYPDTLPANVPPYDNPNSMIDHEFVGTYFAPDSIGGYRARIVGQILQRIASLQSPEKSFECKDPDEVPLVVYTRQATSVSSHSARLNAYVESGKSIGAIFTYSKTSDGNPSNCNDNLDILHSIGNFNTGDSFYAVVNNLEQNTSYSFRSCGREGNRIFDGGVLTFKTNITCGTPLSADGGSEGLSVNFGMGPSAGYATVEFEAYQIPDKLVILHGGRQIYSTNGYVSGYHSSRVYHNPSYGQEWVIKVYGNTNTGTAWDLNITCPQN